MTYLHDIAINMNNVSFYNKNLKWIRTMRGISQQQLADDLGLNRNNIASYELGNSKPDMLRALSIARYFNCSLEQMILTDFEVHPPKLNKKNLQDEAVGDRITRQDQDVQSWKAHHDLLGTMVTAYEAMFSMDAEDDLNFVFNHGESLRIIRLLRKGEAVIGQMLDHIEKEH